MRDYERHRDLTARGETRHVPETALVRFDVEVLSGGEVGNNHLSAHDGRTLPAQFVGRDPSNDLAVLRVQGLGVNPASASEPARVGQFVLAVGRPS